MSLAPTPPVTKVTALGAPALALQGSATDSFDTLVTQEAAPCPTTPASGGSPKTITTSGSGHGVSPLQSARRKAQATHISAGATMAGTFTAKTAAVKTTPSATARTSTDVARPSVTAKSRPPAAPTPLASVSTAPDGFAAGTKPTGAIGGPALQDAQLFAAAAGVGPATAQSGAVAPSSGAAALHAIESAGSQAPISAVALDFDSASEALTDVDDAESVSAPGGVASMSPASRGRDSAPSLAVGPRATPLTSASAGASDMSALAGAGASTDASPGSPPVPAPGGAASQSLIASAAGAGASLVAAQSAPADKATSVAPPAENQVVATVASPSTAPAILDKEPPASSTRLGGADGASRRGSAGASETLVSKLEVARSEPAAPAQATSALQPVPASPDNGDDEPDVGTASSDADRRDDAGDSDEALSGLSLATFAPVDGAPSNTTAPLAGAATPLSASAADLAAQMAAKVTGGASQFRLQLNPLGLGKVDVVVSIGADRQLTASLAFADAQTASAFSAHAGELKGVLEQAGFSVPAGGFDFSAIGVTASTNGSQGGPAGGGFTGGGFGGDDQAGRGGQGGRIAFNASGALAANAHDGSAWTRGGADSRLDIRI